VRRVRALLGLLLVGLALAGCSLVPTSKSPQLLAPKQVGLGLLGKTIPGTNNGRVRFISQPIAIIDATGHLSASSRIVPSPPVLESVLRQLIIGPTKIESFAGYTSALPKNLIILSASFRDGIGYIDLGSSLSKLSRSQEVLAVGQLVLTSRDVGITLGISLRGVEINVAGVTQDSPIPGGREAVLVTYADFRRLLNS
jgi:sporulation and spore germination protein